jgi:pentatricopeptide repeat protein
LDEASVIDTIARILRVRSYPLKLNEIYCDRCAIRVLTCYSALIPALLQQNKPDTALELLKEMEASAIEPTKEILSALERVAHVPLQSVKYTQPLR